MLYAFVYLDGLNTTYANGKYRRVCGHVEAFLTRAERDAYVQATDRVPGALPGCYAMRLVRPCTVRELRAMGYGNDDLAHAREQSC